jgi:hypothetical protein
MTLAARRTAGVAATSNYKDSRGEACFAGPWISRSAPTALRSLSNACGFSLSDGNETDTGDNPMARKELIKAVAYFQTS